MYQSVNNVTFSIVLVWKIDNDFPLAVGVGCSLGSTVENIRWTEIAALLVIIFGVGVTTETNDIMTDCPLLSLPYL